MPFSPLAQEHLRATLTELQHALLDHEQWCENLNKALICTHVPDERDLSENAHRLCRFGQWLHGEASADHGLDRPRLTRIEAAHKLLHARARALLQLSSAGKLIPSDEYDAFSTVLNQLRAEVSAIEHALGSAILNVDPLTGAATRTGMLAEVRKQHSLVSRNLQRTCVAMMDLDNFKQVNDRYGHATGDEVLCRSAGFLMSRMRPYDAFFRYGGEEFLLCTPNADIEQARTMIERLRKALAKLEIEGDAHPPIKVTASFGLATLEPDVPVEISIERADKALYAAKAAGRNRTMTWRPSLA